MVRAGFPDHATYAADITFVTAIPSRLTPKSPPMKKYLPSLDEIIPGVIIILIGFVAWRFVAPAVDKLTMKLTPAKAA